MRPVVDAQPDLAATHAVRRNGALLLAATVAGGCAYKPGSFRHSQRDFQGQRATVGCLDLAIYHRPGLVDAGTVLAYEFGNRCDGPATVDFASTRVVGRTLTGEQVALAPYDPNSEIRALRIDGRGVGAEAIAYPASEPLAQVCVDAASLARVNGERWLCFSIDQPPHFAEAEVER